MGVKILLTNLAYEVTNDKGVFVNPLISLTVGIAAGAVSAIKLYLAGFGILSSLMAYSLIGAVATVAAAVLGTIAVDAYRRQKPDSLKFREQVWSKRVPKSLHE